MNVTALFSGYDSFNIFQYLDVDQCNLVTNSFLNSEATCLDNILTQLCIKIKLIQTNESLSCRLDTLKT